MEAFIHWTARGAFVLYVLALLVWRRNSRVARLLWTGAFLVLVIHVAAAFQGVHHWSHRAAYEDTARQTAELVGQEWGGGIYANYALLLAWLLDVIWWWSCVARYQARSKAVTRSIHGFLAFMWLNAAVVFAHGWFRWVGLVGFVLLAWTWLQNKTASAGVQRKQSKQ